MSQRQVRVQLDSDLVSHLDSIAKSRGTSRSALLRAGALAVVEADKQRTADQRLTDAYRLIPEDPALIESASRLAARTVPDW
ncbi:MAG: ribbon-helix-helix protein, CopG family [Acidimicrobiaceae bacterium]|nr:ribbon-helix-helix protein, CopG family [Acidimicrobiaceae bacterium]